MNLINRLKNKKMTKITIEIHASGAINEAIIRMITSHNEGKIEMPLSAVNWRAKCYHLEWNTISPEFAINEHEPQKIVEVFENGKHTITLQWKKIHELAENNPNNNKHE